jgi:mRNA interferase MazF
MISRGQIYMVDLNPAKGREQKGRRPVLVVSADAINRQPLAVTVVVGTKAANVPRDYPTNVRVSAGESGLPASESGIPVDTIFLCFQIRSRDPGRFAGLNLAGSLSVKKMAEVDHALKLALSLS